MQEGFTVNLHPAPTSGSGSDGNVTLIATVTSVDGFKGRVDLTYSSQPTSPMPIITPETDQVHVPEDDSVDAYVTVTLLQDQVAFIEVLATREGYYPADDTEMVTG